MNATTEKHPDIQRYRQCEQILRDFSYFTSPYYPKDFHETKKTLQDSSKPFQIIHQYFEIDDMVENLPHSSGYLLLQLSDDEQYLYCGIMVVTKERKITYNVTKLALTSVNRDLLFRMITTLAQNKTTMQKAPITIEEDLINLERDSNEEIAKLIEQMEAFFEPITSMLDPIINPALDEPAGEEEGAAPAKAGKADAKKDDKKAAKAPAKGGKGAEAQLAAFESNLPLPTSGIESLIFVLDSKIESLPFESLKVFENVPVMSRDFNLHMYMQRLKTLGHQAEIHNNKGVTKESLSYIIDPPKSLNKESEEVSESLSKMIPGS